MCVVGAGGCGFFYRLWVVLQRQNGGGCGTVILARVTGLCMLRYGDVKRSN